MSNSSPSNSIWPSNGIIGSEQNQIPDGVNEKWPEGDALVGNFVYKEGKLTGFVDCKSLVINDSKSTIIPYDYAELELPFILKDTMTITGGERCKNLIIRCLEDAADYITPMLKEILGDAKFITEFIKEENKLIVHTDRLDDETLTTVSELLERVLPQNMEVERYNQSIDISWKDWTPGFTNVEYLESTGTQWIRTEIKLSNESEVRCEYMATNEEFTRNQALYGYFVVPRFASYGLYTDSHGCRYIAYIGQDGSSCDFPISVGQKNTLVHNGKSITFNGQTSNFSDTTVFEQTSSCFLFTAHEMYGCFRVYSFSIFRNGQLQCNFIPALDETGTPCMYDLVSKKPYYNSGTGDFLYPTDAAPAAAIGMDDKFYAKLTEHGVRRLYKVPDGCNMTKDEYAAANGFKEIVEPPMPQTGYWMPEWRETDTQIVCEWIETEPPTEIES